MNPDENKKNTWANFWGKSKELAIQALVILAAVILVILVSWGIIKLVPSAINGVASIGTSVSSLFKPKEAIAVDASPKVAASGAAITLSWNHVSRAAVGTYSVSYACAPGLTFKLRPASGDDQAFPCGKYLAVGDAKSVVLVGSTTQNRLIETPVTIAFTNTATKETTLTGSTSIAITNDSLPFTGGTDTTGTDSGTNGTGTVRPTTPVTQAEYGNPDLAVRLIATGVVTPAGQFIQKSSVNAGEKAAARFKVVNLGTRSSGTWRWSALLPNTANEVYNSHAERSLAPGDSIEFTLGFDNIARAGTNTMTVSVDEASAVADSNRGNNALSISFFSTTSSGGGIYNPGTGYGLADLSVRILDVDGTAYQQNYSGYYASGSHTVRVEVKNIGGNASQQWTYTVQLPTGDCQNTQYGNSYNSSGNISCNGSQAVYNGSTQAGLAVGQSVILTVVFTTGCSSNSFPYPYNNSNNTGCNSSYSNGSGIFTFTADPYGSVQDQNRSNNSATTYVRTY